MLKQRYIARLITVNWRVWLDTILGSWFRDWSTQPESASAPGDDRQSRREKVRLMFELQQDRP